MLNDCMMGTDDAIEEASIILGRAATIQDVVILFIKENQLDPQNRLWLLKEGEDLKKAIEEIKTREKSTV